MTTNDVTIRDETCMKVKVIPLMVFILCSTSTLRIVNYRELTYPHRVKHLTTDFYSIYTE